MTNERDPGISATREGSDQPGIVHDDAREAPGTVMIPANQPQTAPGEDVKNPLGEETIRVRVRPGMSFQFQGDFVREGDEFDMPVSMARNAAPFIDHITEDGKLRSVPPPSQSVAGIPRSNVAGLARHERVQEYRRELESLQKREVEVQKSLDHELAQIEADKQRSASAAATSQPATDIPAYRPGVSGGHGNVAVPPRPGEPGATVVDGPRGPARLKTE